MIPKGAVRVRVVSVKGSAPRGEGTQMWVWPDPNAQPVPWSGGEVRAATAGTIGGGALEAEAMGRALSAAGPQRLKYALGPALGQCCGGAVELEISPSALPAPQAGRPVWVWGAGHVGRALVGLLAPLSGFDVTWVDTHPGRFPTPVPAAATQLVAAVPQTAMAHASGDAAHFVLTYSHDMDLALCHAALSHRFSSLGLIGSASKWARFQTRLSQLGHSNEAIARITCPIGDRTLGKDPQAIAIGVAHSLLSGRMAGESRV